MEYLTNMESDILNKYGISKTLMCRRETIFLKHIMKNLFTYKNEEDLNNILEVLNFSLFKYMQFITDKLRGIYKIDRSYQNDCDKIVKTEKSSFIEIINLYKDLKPIVIVDFDRTITNKKFHSLYKYLYENNINIYINSANPDEDCILKYLKKYDLQTPKHIYANKGKQKKINMLKNIAIRNTRKIIFFIDDELEYLEYGSLLCMHCYQYAKNGKIYERSIFQK